jgi:hypothetical protein
LDLDAAHPPRHGFLGDADPLGELLLSQPQTLEVVGSFFRHQQLRVRAEGIGDLVEGLADASTACPRAANGSLGSFG